MKPFFARQARRPNQASSVAMMIDVAKARNSNIEHPFRYQADYGWKGSVALIRGRANGDLQLEKCEAVSIWRMFRYSRNVIAPTVSEA
jgi:hypothetical protein